jgi:hypothetical protein
MINNNSEAFTVLQLHLDSSKRIAKFMDSNEDHSDQFKEHLLNTIKRLENIYNLLD